MARTSFEKIESDDCTAEFKYVDGFSHWNITNVSRLDHPANHRAGKSLIGSDGIPPDLSIEALPWAPPYDQGIQARGL